MKYNELILVAGPSGAGKSTFIRQLLAGQLSEETTLLLPPGARSALHLKGDGLVSSLAVEPAPEMRRLAIVDYDMTHRELMKQGYDFHADPKLLRLIELTDSVTVVTLKVPIDRLTKQLTHREGRLTNPAMAELSIRLGYALRLSAHAVSRALPTAVLNRFRRVRSIPRVWNKRLASRSGDQLAKLQHYRSAGWLDDLYNRWQSSLAALGREGIDFSQVWLEPDPNSPLGGRVSWKCRKRYSSSAVRD
jgi:energy-coupling factor transporter ATP-binding protein EcfA2